MAFGAEPAEICPHTTETPLRTSTLRDSTAGTFTAIWANANTRSSVRCGLEVWPPRPESSILMVSDADVMAPMRVPIWPTLILGSQCSARMRGTPSSTPCSMQDNAPPGIVSSAGWKMIRTVPPSGLFLCIRWSVRAMPSIAVVWTSCPQACVTPWFLEANGRPVSSMIGKASMSPRRAVAMGPSPTSTVSPVPSSRRGLSPAASSRSTSLSVVRNSLNDSSGCAWRSRRNSMSPGSSSSTQGLTTGAGSVSVV
ncbi:hypothetical protein PJL18_01835 [Paenarthrobacter nicotinovorans]|nr:hypothetical protein [Paenarthrobacter nicotinovorans]